MNILYSKSAVKAINSMDKSAKQRIKQAIHFVPTDIDDITTPEDLSAHETAMKEYRAGEATPHDMINWD